MPQMVELRVPEDVIRAATTEALALGRLRNSITGGEGNTAGFIGKRMVSGYLDLEYHPALGYELVHEKVGKISTHTKRCTSKPKAHYECSITGYNTLPQADVFVFTRLLTDYTKIWILGWMTRDNFLEESTRYEEGVTDSSNGHTFHCDTHNVMINQLEEIEELLKQKENRGSGIFPL